MLSVKDSFLELQGTVLNASMCFDAWWELKNAGNPAHATYQRVIKPYCLYFNAAADAQLLAVIVLLYQAFETRTDTQNFGALISRIEIEDPAAKQLVSDLRIEAAELKPAWTKIARARSTVMAHLSHKGSSEELMALADLTPNVIDSFIKAARKLLDRLTRHFGMLGSALLHPNVKAHTKKLMHALERASSRVGDNS